MHQPVVLDTNILVASGFKRESASARIVDLVRAGQLRMAWNEGTRREIERVLRRIPPLRGIDASDLFREEDRIEEVGSGDFAMISDPDDRVFAAVAVSAGATIVTNDDHLLSCRDQLRVPVLTAGAFWEMLAARARHPSPRTRRQAVPGTDHDEGTMIRLFDAETDEPLGSISEAQLEFLMDEMEEESSTDRDYYINGETIEMLEEHGAEKELVAVLREALADRDEMEVRWEGE